MILYGNAKVLTELQIINMITVQCKITCRDNEVIVVEKSTLLYGANVGVVS